VYVLPTATDWDGPALGVQRYKLDTAPYDGKFGIQTTRKLDGSMEVRKVGEVEVGLVGGGISGRGYGEGSDGILVHYVS